MRDIVNASDYRNMILCADTALRKNIQQINDLNVFPVPDGDTGTNMSLTMKSAADELRKREFNDISSVADCAANALLRGARGNSGVILSLLFRGIAKRLKNLETAGPSEFAGALMDGVDAAYKAVMKPAEGTILTVSRLASKAASKAAGYGADLEGVFICAVKEGKKALADTENINPVLKKAGVVDAGGKGYMVILEAMIASLRGEMIPEADSPSEPIPESSSEKFGMFETESITFAFDTVFIVRKKDEKTNILPFREYLDGIGDCLVISEGDEEFKVHVHTNKPGSALNEAGKYGTLELAKIENMRSQHEAVAAGKGARSTDDLAAVEKELEAQADAGEGSDSKSVSESADAGKNSEDASDSGYAEAEKELGVVTVCAGAGLEEIFRELGVDSIVTGGQTMNPSTNDILKAVNSTPASTVFVLPNNKNIFMAAEQCAPLTDKKVVVIPTRSVAQGITAMLNFNPDEEEEALKSGLCEAIQNVHTVMVTYAARNSDFDGHDIHAGEYLALFDGALLDSYRDTGTLIEETGKKIAEYNPQFLTVYYGADVAEADAESFADGLREGFPEAEVSVVNGGQPVYYYMISVE